MGTFSAWSEEVSPCRAAEQFWRGPETVAGPLSTPQKTLLLLILDGKSST